MIFVTECAGVLKYYFYSYHSFMKECPWKEHLTSSPKRRVGTLLNLAIEEHPRNILRQLDALNKQQHTTELPVVSKSNSDSTQHSD